MKHWILWFACALWALGCNYTEGQCWYRGQGGDVGSGVGVGGSFGVSVGAGVGGRGDYYGPQGEGPSGEETPPACNESDLEKADPKPSDPDAPQAGAFAPSLFKFKMTIPDDGTDKGGGEQQADTVLTFMDWRKVWPKFWTCNVTVRMPLRTALRGTITADKAAKITAKAANRASSEVLHSQSDWLPVLFCIRFGDRMNELFKKEKGYEGYGARVSAR